MVEIEIDVDVEFEEKSERERREHQRHNFLVESFLSSTSPLARAHLCSPFLTQLR